MFDESMVGLDFAIKELKTEDYYFWIKYYFKLY